MTGYARVRRPMEGGEIIVSLKSVNHRALDLHFHLPSELDPIENEIRAVIKKGVARGHMQVNVSLNRQGGGSASFNRELLEMYLGAFEEAAKRYGIVGQPDLNSALRLPGMLTAASEPELSDATAKAVLETVGEAVAALNVFREREGKATADELRMRCRNIVEIVGKIEGIRAGAVPAFQKRLRERLDELLRGAQVEPQRLAQEAAILADRSDIAEELVRLRTHSAHLEEMLDGQGEIGKRLDFLLQEMNRESNTILSKTGGLGDLGLTLTNLGLTAKSEIDKIREQSLNLE
jgi:uncharacterized protein (TIGR00255 family)